ncbi:uncharacterized protein RAG0_15557 [Rhynchosporium agropyri]|uniref:Uncharacterized protein n=1 Tax=Rhynchosporium agropyri TaxID=914238 RepID=A0A1E1LLN0_9HELO|nr:uncharacterized protein RAG0_15557 [Rhynchosporium agropyri]
MNRPTDPFGASRQKIQNNNIRAGIRDLENVIRARKAAGSTLPAESNAASAEKLQAALQEIKTLEADLHHAKVEIGTRHEEGFRLKLDAELSSDRAEATAQTMKDLRARDAMPMGDWATETSETKNLKDQIEGLDRKIDGYQEDLRDLIDMNEALQFSLAATSRKGENPAGSSSAGDEVHKLKREKAELERQPQALEGKLKQMRGWITSRGATSEHMSTDYLAGLYELLGWADRDYHIKVLFGRSYY